MQEELRRLATAFMGVSKDGADRSKEDAISTPLPGETLAMFYSRSREPFNLFPEEDDKQTTCLGEYWAQKALDKSDNRGKMLRRDGFSLAEEKYGTILSLFDCTMFAHIDNRELQAYTRGSPENTCRGWLG